MKNAKYIEAHYTKTLQFDIGFLNIDWKDVKNHWVKWRTLYIELNNGKIIETDNAIQVGVDWQWSGETEVLDKDFSELHHRR